VLKLQNLLIRRTQNLRHAIIAGTCFIFSIVDDLLSVASQRLHYQAAAHR
jgi:hypothetical protein